MFSNTDGLPKALAKRTSLLSDLSCILSHQACVETPIFSLKIIWGWCHLEWCQKVKPTSVKHVSACQLWWQKSVLHCEISAEADSQYYSCINLCHFSMSVNSLVPSVHEIQNAFWHSWSVTANYCCMNTIMVLHSCHCWFCSKTEASYFVTAPNIRTKKCLCSTCFILNFHQTGRPDMSHESTTFSSFMI